MSMYSQLMHSLLHSTIRQSCITSAYQLGNNQKLHVAYGYRLHVMQYTIFLMKTKLRAQQRTLRRSKHSSWLLPQSAHALAALDEHELGQPGASASGSGSEGSHNEDGRASGLA